MYESVPESRDVVIRVMVHLWLMIGGADLSLFCFALSWKVNKYLLERLLLIEKSYSCLQFGQPRRPARWLASAIFDRFPEVYRGLYPIERAIG
ncbi:MAG TPA: hypothetical protein VE134_02960, partial [Methanomicrobiales archaeon]|nr:hypothetical protein [Methanomicrobiales archaeon]